MEDFLEQIQILERLGCSLQGFSGMSEPFHVGDNPTSITARVGGLEFKSEVGGDGPQYSISDKEGVVIKDIPGVSLNVWETHSLQFYLLGKALRESVDKRLVPYKNSEDTLQQLETIKTILF